MQQENIHPLYVGHVSVFLMVQILIVLRSVLVCFLAGLLLVSKVAEVTALGMMDATVAVVGVQVTGSLAVVRTGRVVVVAADQV